MTMKPTKETASKSDCNMRQLFTLTDFLAGRWTEFVEDPDDDEERHVKLDTLHPAGLVRINSDSPFVELHLLRLDVQNCS